MYLIPEVKSLTLGNGSYILPYYGEIVLENSCTGEDFFSARTIQDELRDTLGFIWEIQRGRIRPEKLRQGSIRLSIVEGAVNPGDALFGESRKQAEGYELHIGEDGIEIIGNSSAGLWYGVQTLRQMLRQEGAVLPFIDVMDEPEIPNRGFYHDVTRGRIPTMEELKKLVDKMAYYKLNQLQLYVEHSFLFQEFSEVWRDDTPLTAEDILELDRYCTERHVELVPSLASFGHLYKVLRTREYSHLCELPDSEKESFSFVGRMAHHTVDVTNPESFALVKNMIEAFIPLFSSRHFNVCADETFDLGTGRSREEGERVGRQSLYMGFLKQVCQLIVDHGRIPMFWGDIICKFPEAVKELPKGTICLNWGYDPQQSDEAIRRLHDAGAIQYACPGVQGWNNLVNDMKGAYENISRMCRYAVQHDAIGVLNTDWGDYGHINHPEFSTVGMIYGAAFSWNPQIPERAEINQQISFLEYGDRSGRFVDLISGLYECSLFNWFFMVVYKEGKQGRITYDADWQKDWFSMERIKWDTLEEAEQTLNELQRQLYAMLPDMEQRGRSRVYAYLLASEGIHLMNRIGQVVHRREQQSRKELQDVADCGIRADRSLASELEHWYRRYCALWRSVSRESELYRIREVIQWYGDYLREA